MQKYIFVLFVLCVYHSHAEAKWMCHETASLKSDKNIFMSCGVGSGATEAEARKEALLNAQEEFKLLCDQDITCNGYKTTIKPLRNSCTKTADVYKCYRGFEYQVTTVRSTNVDDLDKELKIKEAEFNAAKEAYEKQKKIKELDEKINNKEFDLKKTSHIFVLGLQGSASYSSAGDVSASGISLGAYAKYIPKERFGLQLKVLNFNGSQNDYQTTFLNNRSVLTSEVNGSVKTASLIFHFSDIHQSVGGSGFIGLGVGNSSYSYTHSFTDGTQEKLSSETGVRVINFGYTASQTFDTKTPGMGLELGIDIYTFDGQSPYDYESITDIYMGIGWGF